MKQIRINLNRSPDSLSIHGQIVSRMTATTAGVSGMTRPGNAADASVQRPSRSTAAAPTGTPRTDVSTATRAGGSQVGASPSAVAPAAVANVAAQDVQHLRELLNTVAESFAELQQQHRQSLEELQQVAVELSVSAASWLTGVAIDADQFAVDDMIRLALQRLEADTPVRVRLNPADQILLQQLMKTSETGGSLQQINCVDDAALPRGSCRVESGRRILVSDMESRLEAIRTLWMENLDAAQIERRGDDSHGRSLRRFPDRRETA